jgi:uncharacterized membrane protein
MMMEKKHVLNYLKLNTRYLVIGIILIISGYGIMAWNSPANLSYEARVSAFHKITLAPIVLIIGYIAIGLAIMIPTKAAKK